jgi:hypothetical protein
VPPDTCLEPGATRDRCGAPKMARTSDDGRPMARLLQEPIGIGRLHLMRRKRLPPGSNAFSGGQRAHRPIGHCDGFGSSKDPCVHHRGGRGSCTSHPRSLKCFVLVRATNTRLISLDSRPITGSVKAIGIPTGPLHQLRRSAGRLRLNH